MKLRISVGVVCVLMSSVPLWAAGPDLPPGPMKKKVQSTCVECHDLSRIVKQKHDKKWWAQTLTKMEGLGAQVDDDEREALLNYLSKNFGEGKTAGKGAKK
jgi:competence protein ComEA